MPRIFSILTRPNPPWCGVGTETGGCWEDGGGAEAILAAKSSSMLFMVRLEPAVFLLWRMRMVAFLSAKEVSMVLMAVSISAHFRCLCCSIESVKYETCTEK